MRARATPEERLRGMADLANELTNERARADGRLNGRSDNEMGREIEERYGAMREAMMDDLAADQADVFARLQPAEPLEEFRSHSAREAATRGALEEVKRSLLESGASEEDVERMFRRPEHIPSQQRVEEMRQAAIDRAAALRERHTSGRSSNGVQWPPRGGER